MNSALNIESHQSSSEPLVTVDNYRFEHFSLGLALQDMRFSPASLRAGDLLPDDSLLNPDGKEVSLRTLADGRPVVLVTGSISCPLTVSVLPDLNQLETRYRDRVQFVLLQVREAHPGEAINQPHILQEKLDHARLMRDVHGVRWPVLVDDVDGSLHRLLDTMPNSLHIVGEDGEILYRALFAGDTGVEKAIASISAGDRPPKKGSQSMLPILKSAGFMHDTLARAGAGAYSDLFKTAPPMAGLALAGC